MHPIAEYRRARGLTQNMLAKKLETNLNQIQRWESGVTPRAPALLRLAEALGVDSLALDRELRATKPASAPAEKVIAEAKGVAIS